MSEASKDSAFDTGGEEESATAFGMWIFLASEAMVFGAALLVYALGRIAHPEGFGAASNLLDWRLGAANTVVLLVSSFAIARAHDASLVRHRARTAAWVVVTGILGAVFLAVKGWEWSHEVEAGLAPLLGLPFDYDGPDPDGAAHFFRVYFVLTGLHAAHMLGGLAAMGWILATWRRRHAQTDMIAVRSLGLYWHFVDIVWIFLFPLLYLIARA